MENILGQIYKSSLKFLEPLSAEKTYELIVREGITLVNGDDGVLHLYVNRQIVPVYASSPEGLIVNPRKKGFTYHAIKYKMAFVVDSKNFAPDHKALIEQGIKTTIFIPLSYRNKTIGVLIVRSYQEGRFKDLDLQVLKLFGSMASLAIRKAQLNQETQQALELRNLFIRMASHELRTPLTTVNAYTQLLYNSLKDKKTEEGTWVRRLHRENERLTKLVQELLEINRVNTGELLYVWEECSLSQIINMVEDNFNKNHTEAKLQIAGIRKKAGHSVFGDPNKLIQVFTNLLDNAVKFSPVDKPIKLRFAELSEYYVISIIDKGRGIDPKHMPKVFTPFFKGVEDSGGWGLGLYLVKEIIQKHHGKVGINSRLDKGTTFRVYLPKANYE